MKIIRLFSFLALAAALTLVVAPARAEIVLTDLNSTATIDPLSQAGMNSWTVDGTNQMYQQWFWYRIGATGGEASIDTLGTPTVTQFLGDRGVTIDYSQAGGLDISVLYILTGGNAGSHVSDIAETIRISNNSSNALDFHFFQYSDFDLNGVEGGQTVQVGADKNSFMQTGNGVVVSETVVTPRPSLYEANYYANTLGALNLGGPTTLNDTGFAGPGDVTWAFEWDVNLAPNGSFTISKDKNLAAAVPEPATILAFGTILLVVGRKLKQGLSR